MKISVSLEIVIRLFFSQDCTFELLPVPTYNESEETEVAHMREQKFHIYLDSHERTILLHSLVELKNQLLAQGRYADCIDELIFKVTGAPLKKLKVQHDCGRV